MQSFINRAHSFIRSRSNPGQDLRQEELIPTLTFNLSKIVGELVPMKGRLHTKIPSRVYGVASNKGNAVKKVLKDLDFSVVQITSSGYTGGTRLEMDTNKTTVVNYCSYSGILVITSTLEFLE
jgi:hypothetical protein